MRRVASSLGMRRSNSFFWTPVAHHDFERAVSFLTQRGVEVSAAHVLHLMGQHYVDLKVTDVDKHMRKRLLVQRRVQQQLMAPPNFASAAANHRNSSGNMPFAAATDFFPPVAPEFTIPPLSSSRMPGVLEESADACRLSEQFSQQQQAHRQLAVMQEQMQATL